MPRNGSGVYSKPAGSTATTGTTVLASEHNTPIDDLVTDANTFRPVVAGGTGVGSAADVQTTFGIADKASTATISGAWTYTANFTLNNDVHAYFGTSGGNQLDIYHNGTSTGFVTADASLTLRGESASSLVQVQGYTVKIADEANGAETMATFQSDGSVDLYYDNSKKFETTTAGVTVTGTTTTTGLTATGAASFGAEIVENVASISGTTPELDPADGTVQTWTLSGSSTPTEVLADGEFIELHIDDGTANTITWPTMEWLGGSAPTLSTTETSIIVLQKVGSTLIGQFRGTAS